MAPPTCSLVCIAFLIINVGIAPALSATTPYTANSVEDLENWFRTIEPWSSPLVVSIPAGAHFLLQGHPSALDKSTMLEIPTGAEVIVKSEGVEDTRATLDARGLARVFRVEKYGKLTIKNMQLTGGMVQHENTSTWKRFMDINWDDGPDGICFHPENIRKNSQDTGGGCVLGEEGSKVRIEDSSISDCFAYTDNQMKFIGGWPPEMVYDGSEIYFSRHNEWNMANDAWYPLEGSGGCAASWNGTLELVNSQLSGCGADAGGGVYGGMGAEIIVTNTRISDCNAKDVGGGIHVFGYTGCEGWCWSHGCFIPSALHLNEDSAIENCSAGKGGGGVAVSGGSSIVMEASTVRGCRAGDLGGGLMVMSHGLSETLTVSKSAFIDCIAVNPVDPKTPSNGGGGIALAFYARGFWMESSSITNCHAGWGTGGAIQLFANDCEATLVDTVIQGCSAIRGGGAIYLRDGGVLALEGCTIKDSWCDQSHPSSSGGAIEACCRPGEMKDANGVPVPNTVTMSSTQIRNCSARIGGAWNGREAALHMYDSTISDCHATEEGGALYGYDPSIANLGHSKIHGCTSGSSGGAVYWQSSFSLSNSTVIDCGADKQSGAIMVLGSTTVSHSTISNCKAGEDGGSMAVGKNASLMLLESNITNSIADTGKGGAIHVERDGKAHVQNSVISACQAATGGCAAAEGSIKFVGSQLAQCAASKGAAVSIEFGSSVELENTTMRDSVATEAGGGVHVNAEGRLSITKGSIIRNTYSSTTGGCLNILSRGQAWVMDSQLSGCAAEGTAGVAYVQSYAKLSLWNVLVDDSTVEPDSSHAWKVPGVYLYETAQFHAAKLKISARCDMASYPQIAIDTMKTTIEEFEDTVQLRGVRISAPLSCKDGSPRRLAQETDPLIFVGRRDPEISQWKDLGMPVCQITSCGEAAECYDAADSANVGNVRETYGCTCTPPNKPHVTALTGAYLGLSTDSCYGSLNLGLPSDELAPFVTGCATPPQLKSINPPIQHLRLHKSQVEHEFKTFSMVLVKSGTYDVEANWEIDTSTLHHWTQFSEKSGTFAGDEFEAHIDVTISTAGVSAKEKAYDKTVKFRSSAYLPEIDMPYSSEKDVVFIYYVTADTVAQTSTWGEPGSNDQCGEISKALHGHHSSACNLRNVQFGEAVVCRFTGCDKDGLAVRYVSNQDDVASFKAVLVDSATGGEHPMSIEYQGDGIYAVTVYAPYFADFGLKLTFRGEQVQSALPVTYVCPANMVVLPDKTCGCDFDYESDGAGGCQRCSSVWYGNSEQGKGTCEVLALPVVMIVLAGLLFILLVVLVVGALMARSFRKKLKLIREAEKLETNHIIITEAMAAMLELRFPYVIMPAKTFIQMGKMIPHEKAPLFMNNFLHTVDDIVEFCVSNRILFFSHQWLSFTEPDPDNIQYNCMLQAINEITKEFEWNLEDVHVWLDYLSIPQIVNSSKKGAIASLPIYAALADAFVTVAPTTKHAQKSEECNLHTYQERLWCRVEVFCHFAFRGQKRMYVHTGRKLEHVKVDWIKRCLPVFSGEATCCALKHKNCAGCDKEKLLRPVLGVYSEMLRRQSMDDMKEVYAMIQEQKDVIFPTNYKCEYLLDEIMHFDNSQAAQRSRRKGPKDKVITECRELFGSLIVQLEETTEKDMVDATMSTDTEGVSTATSLSKKTLAGLVAESFEKRENLGIDGLPKLDVEV